MNAKSGRANRTLLWTLQKGVCPICKGKMPHPMRVYRAGRSEDDASPTIDHVIPRASGGPNSMLNYVAVHRRCNNKKSDQPHAGVFEMASTIRAAIIAAMPGVTAIAVPPAER